MATKGIFAAVVTPVDNTGAISIERYCRHARWLLRQGCAGIGVFGTTSEANSFSVPERQATLDAFLAAGLEANKIILGIGTCASGRHRGARPPCPRPRRHRAVDDAALLLQEQHR